MFATAEPDTRTSELEELSDADLLARFVEKGDQRAFAALHDRYERRIKNFLRSRYGLSDTEQEDLWQETMMRVHRHAHRYDPEVSAFRNWLYMIASNLGKNVLRNRDHDPTVDFSTLTKNFDEDDRPLEFPDHSSTPERALEKKQARELVERGLLELRPHHRVVLLLLEFRGYSYKRTAEVVGLNLGTVKSRKHRAVEFFRSAVKRFSDRPLVQAGGRITITEDGDLAWAHPERENGASPWSLMRNGEPEDGAAPETPDAIREALLARGWTRDEATGHWLQPSKRQARVFLDEFVDVETDLAARWFVRQWGKGRKEGARNGGGSVVFSPKLDCQSSLEPSNCDGVPETD